MGNNFFLKQIFSGENFGDQVLDSFGEEILPANFLEKNVIRGKKRIEGRKDVLKERYGEQNFLRANFYH